MGSTQGSSATNGMDDASVNIDVVEFASYGNMSGRMLFFGTNWATLVLFPTILVLSFNSQYLPSTHTANTRPNQYSIHIYSTHLYLQSHLPQAAELNHRFYNQCHCTENAYPCISVHRTFILTPFSTLFHLRTGASCSCHSTPYLILFRTRFPLAPVPFPVPLLVLQQYITLCSSESDDADVGEGSEVGRLQ